MTEQLPKGYSPRLYNQDLGPLPQKWTWYNIFAFWMSDVHSVGGYVFAASLFALGLASWQVLIALLAGICIVQLIANLVAKPSQQAAVPYPVICRLAFGVFGANIPAVIRGLIAVAPRHTGLRCRSGVHTGGGLVCIRDGQQNACQ